MVLRFTIFTSDTVFNPLKISWNWLYFVLTPLNTFPSSQADSIAFHFSSTQWKMPNQLKQFAVSKVLAIKVAHSTHTSPFSQSIKCLLINRRLARGTDNFPDAVRQLLWQPNENRTSGQDIRMQRRIVCINYAASHFGSPFMVFYSFFYTVWGKVVPLESV